MILKHKFHRVSQSHIRAVVLTITSVWYIILFQVHRLPDFSPCLLQIIMNDGVPFPSRQAGKTLQNQLSANKVRMYVYMYVCIYVCMYVNSMYICINMCVWWGIHRTLMICTCSAVRTCVFSYYCV